MSSRFGRNKKRKLKDEISRLEAKTNRLENKVASQSNLFHKAEYAIAMINRIAPNCIALDPRIIAGRGFDASKTILSTLPNLRDVSLLHMEASIRDMGLADKSHVCVKVGDEMTYACSYSGLLALSVEQIAMRIACAIKQEMSKTE